MSNHSSSEHALSCDVKFKCIKSVENVALLYYARPPVALTHTPVAPPKNQLRLFIATHNSSNSCVKYNIRLEGYLCSNCLLPVFDDAYSVTCLRLSNVRVICRVTYLQFPNLIQACFSSM